MDELTHLLEQEISLMNRHYRQSLNNTDNILKQLAIDNYYVYKHQVKKTLILIRLMR